MRFSIFRRAQHLEMTATALITRCRACTPPAGCANVHSNMQPACI
jgi:hypothetical protein